jgi:hypothetical protein
MALKKYIHTLDEVRALDAVLIPVSEHSALIPSPYNRAIIKRPEIHRPYAAACANGFIKQVGHVITQCKSTGATFIFIQVSKRPLDARCVIDAALTRENLLRLNKSVLEVANRIVLQPCVKTQTDWQKEIEPIFLEVFAKHQNKFVTVVD